jgi:hypothetical protein
LPCAVEFGDAIRRDHRCVEQRARVRGQLPGPHLRLAPRKHRGETLLRKPVRAAVVRAQFALCAFE